MIKVRNILINIVVILYITIMLLMTILFSKTIHRIERLEQKVNKLEIQSKMYYEDLLQLFEY